MAFSIFIGLVGETSTRAAPGARGMEGRLAAIRRKKRFADQALLIADHRLSGKTFS